MRTKLRSKFTLLFLSFALVLALPAMALADDIRDVLDTTANETQTIIAGDSTSTGFTNEYFINANSSGTSPQGCDVLAASDSVTATFAVNTPPGVTASASSLTFDECKDGNDLNSQKVKFTSNTPGTYTIPALTKTSGTGTYTVTNTDFTLVVNDNCPNGDTSGNLQDGKCTPNTAPVVSVSGVSNGATYEHGAVPAAGCNVVDAEDTNESANPVKDSSGLNSNGLGLEKVTCSYTDGGGVTKSASATYTIQDTTKPVIESHANVTAEATGANGALVSYTSPTANDAVYGSVNVNCLPASGSTFKLGETTVNCSATDGSGNTQTSTFKVTVVDTTGPSITNVPSDITKEATTNAGAPVIFTIPTATDLVDGSRTVTCSPDSGTILPLGLTEVTCSASDASGNTSSVKFNVTVQDTTPPKIATHDDITGVEATGPDGAKVTYTSPTATDNVDTSVTVNCSPASGSTFGLGAATTVTCTATDNAGNKATSNFKVTVVDTTAPELNLPENRTVEATSANGAAATFARNASDLVDGAVSVNCFVVSTPVKSGDIFALGTTTVDCSATDAAGNKASDSFTVTVRDTTAPAIAAHADVTEEATGPDGALVNYTSPGTTDAVAGNGTANCTPASGTKFALGSTKITCTAKDAAGNEATSTFNVIVKDTTAPAIAAHADVNATATGANGALVNYTSPGTTDAVAGNGTANCTPASGSQFAVGSTKVTCTATDGTNTSTSSFNVIVAYAWSNFLQPINVTGAQSVFKLGSTVPVKFNLTGASAGITDGTFYLKYIYLGAGDGLGEQEAVATTTATTGTEFRYSAGQYIYNWSTKSVSKPGNYELRVYSDAAGTVLLGKVAIEIKK